MLRRHRWIRRPRCSWKCGMVWLFEEDHFVPIITKTVSDCVDEQWPYQKIHDRVPMGNNGKPIIRSNSWSRLSIVCMITSSSGRWCNLVGALSFWSFLRLPRAHEDGKGQAVEKKARVERLGPENNARRKLNKSTCSFGQCLLDPLGFNTWSQGPRFVWYACYLRILGQVASSTGPTINSKIPSRC